MKFLVPFIFCCFLLSCKSSEQKFKEKISIQNATWSTWVGGLPGVGGNNYTVEISTSDYKNITAKNLIVEGQKVEITSQKIQDGILKVMASENKSQKRGAMNAQIESKADFRKNDPKSATITLTSDCCEIDLPIDQFQKTESTPRL